MTIGSGATDGDPPRTPSPPRRGREFVFEITVIMPLFLYQNLIFHPLSSLPPTPLPIYLLIYSSQSSNPSQKYLVTTFFAS